MTLQTALGLRFDRPDSHVKLRLANYANLEALPKPPSVFGHEDAVVTWGTLGNDRYGCCVWAGAAHEHMIWTGEHGRPAEFEDAQVLADYAQATGFDPQTGANDDGTDMIEAAKYRQKIGIADTSGMRHKIDAYAALTPGNWDEMMVASRLFSAVGVGVRFPASAEQQFSDGQPWSVVRGSPVQGGHYVPNVGRNSRGRGVDVTWGRLHAMDRAFYEAYNMTTLAYISFEQLNAKGFTPEQFNLDQLRDDLRRLQS